MSSSRKDELLNYLKNTTSEVIDCSNYNLKNSDFPDLYKALKEKSKITELNISFLSIGLEYIELLKDIILSTNGLIKLRLKYNKLGNDGILSLINDPNLTNLIKHINFDFGNNNIDEDGLEKLYVSADKDLITPDSLLSVLLGNPIYDEQLVEDCINLYKVKTNKDQNETELQDAKENADSSVQDKSSITGSVLLPDHFFSKTASPRTSDTSSKPHSTPSSGTTSKSSTPPGEESIKPQTRKISKSNNTSD